MSFHLFVDIYLPCSAKLESCLTGTNTKIGAKADLTKCVTQAGYEVDAGGKHDIILFFARSQEIQRTSRTKSWRRPIGLLEMTLTCKIPTMITMMSPTDAFVHIKCHYCYARGCAHVQENGTIVY